MDSVSGNFNNMPCEIYFFESWGTYQHPVTPKNPIEFEQTLLREGFCRGWMCDTYQGKLFVYFEGINNERLTTNINKPQADNLFHFYDLNENERLIGKELSPSELLHVKEYLMATPENDVLLKIKQTGYSYEYKYNNEGALSEAVITSLDGRVNTIKY